MALGLPDLSPKPTSALAQDLQETGTLQAQVTGSFGCVFGKSQYHSRDLELLGKKNKKCPPLSHLKASWEREWKEQGERGE